MKQTQTPLKALRKRARMTQIQLAAKAGLSIGTVSQLEQGKRKPTLATLMALRRALGCTLDELVTENMVK